MLTRYLFAAANFLVYILSKGNSGFLWWDASRFYGVTACDSPFMELSFDLCFVFISADNPLPLRRVDTLHNPVSGVFPARTDFHVAAATERAIFWLSASRRPIRRQLVSYLRPRTTQRAGRSDTRTRWICLSLLHYPRTAPSSRT